MLECKKRENETSSSLMFRFSKRVKQSGILTESRRRRFRHRAESRAKKRLSAQHRTEKKTEIARLRKMGLL